jgi:hypothetical protein
MLFFSLLSEFIFICVGSNIMWLFLGRPLLLTWLHQCLNCRTNTNKGQARAHGSAARAAAQGPKNLGAQNFKVGLIYIIFLYISY